MAGTSREPNQQTGFDTDVLVGRSDLVRDVAPPFWRICVAPYMPNTLVLVVRLCVLAQVKVRSAADLELSKILFMVAGTGADPGRRSIHRRAKGAKGAKGAKDRGRSRTREVPPWRRRASAGKGPRQAPAADPEEEARGTGRRTGRQTSQLRRSQPRSLRRSPRSLRARSQSRPIRIGMSGSPGTTPIRKAKGKGKPPHLRPRRSKKGTHHDQRRSQVSRQLRVLKRFAQAVR